ncbi:PREDICTED: odorant receptor 4-like [Dinoponera quadriceps]|uniref:Odorant receptor n=1 Tax=Dinoponera quadriceps TaxID=609295 RepID=A0A6P3Y1P0_DINQU|nr:PREDICTED: odorant receptor 4-like [Dinoponera quadriceps]
MHVNSSHHDDVRRTVHVTRSVLNLIGVWPSCGDSSALRLVWTKSLRMLCQVLLYFIFVPGLLKIFLKESNARRRLKMVGPMCYCLMAMLKHAMLIYQNNRIKDCIRHIEEDWGQVSLAEDRRIMTGNSRIGRNLAILCVAFVYGSGFFYRTILPLSRGTVVTLQNVTIRPLGYNGYYVFIDPQKTPAYEIIFTIQCLCGVVQYSVTSGACSLAALLVLHGCGQFKILIARMEDLTRIEHTSDVNVNRKLAAIVKQHIRIKSFLDKVEDILQYMCLVEVVGCTFILCLLGYYIIMEWEDNDAVSMLTYAILLLTFTLNIFILCFIGELLTNQSTKMYVTSCTLNWYRIPHKTARSLVLVIAVSSVPVKITAGKFLDLSFNSFGAIVRTSVAYLNILRTTSI